MNITIKSCGHNEGTSGWLKSEIERGTIYFGEGISKSGKHGLWMRQTSGDKRRSMLIAIQDMYDSGYPDYAALDISMSDDCNEQPDVSANIYHLTPAAAKAVSMIAQKWCDHKNKKRETDEPLDVVVSFE